MRSRVYFIDVSGTLLLFISDIYIYNDMHVIIENIDVGYFGLHAFFQSFRLASYGHGCAT